MPGQGRGGCLRCFVLNKNGSVGCRELGCYISRIPAPYGECSSIGELDLAAVEALYLPLGYDVRSVYADKLGVGQLYTDIFKNHAGEGACAAGAVNLDIPFHSLDKSDVGEWYRHIVVFLLTSIERSTLGVTAAREPMRLLARAKAVWNRAYENGL